MKLLLGKTAPEKVGGRSPELSVLSFLGPVSAAKGKPASEHTALNLHLAHLTLKAQFHRNSLTFKKAFLHHFLS